MVLVACFAQATYEKNIVGWIHVHVGLVLTVVFELRSGNRRTLGLYCYA